MKLSLRWLSEYVEPRTDDPSAIADALASLGHEVEGWERIEPAFSGVVVARVERVEPHPNADRLRVVDVVTPHERRTVVCGAWNFDEGAVVPVAVPGARLGDLEVGERTIRGVASAGMICSERELGLGEDHEGILVLDPSTELGVDLRTIVPLPDVVFDLSITPNRPDAMSVLGIARELGALWERPVREPEIAVPESGEPSTAQVRIEDPEGCPRFVAREVRDVTVRPSPLWVQLRLRASGMRAINNVVDVTNLVMLELGQPIHAFDLDTLEGETVIARRAREGETIVTLDGVERTLDPADMVVADARRPVAIAGVMGGADTEVTEATRRVLIEAAHWDPPSVMYTARRHGLRTEASARFERGVDPALPPVAADRAAQLFAELADGRPAPGRIDVYPRPIEPWTVELPAREVPRLLGVELGSSEIAQLLERLGFAVEGEDPLVVTVPTRRPDVTRPADLVEEVARLYGYDRIGETLPLGRGGGLTEEQTRERALREALVGAGLHEAMNLSFMALEDLDLLGIGADDERRSVVRVRNPLREEESALRTTLLPGLLRSLRNNRARSIEDVALFEVGRVVLARPSPDDPRLPDQPWTVGWAAIGTFGPHGIREPGHEADVYAATAVVRVLARALRLDLRIRPAAVDPLHPGRSAEVLLDGEPIGYAGELHPATARAFDLDGRVAVGELRLGPLVAPIGWPSFVEPSPFPPVIFDLAFEVDEMLPAADLLDVIRRAGGEIVEEARVFDEFRGASLPEGRKSLAVRIVLRAGRTLTNEDAAEVRRRIVETVEAELGASLRGGG